MPHVLFYISGKFNKMSSGNHFGPHITDGRIEDNMLTGKIKIAAIGEPVSLMIDPEAESTAPEDFTPLLEATHQLTTWLNTGKFQEIIAAVANEINESAYEQQDDMPAPEALTSLINDLMLTGIEVFPEGFMLNFRAGTALPGADIRVQLNEDFSIDDVAIYD